MLSGCSCRSVLDSLPTNYNICSSWHCLSLQPLIFRRPKSCGLRTHVQARPRRPPLALVAHASIQELTNNQVLVSVVTATLIGQALKPFTAALQGKGFNWKMLIASGGMPSSHSSSVTAACTSIALERGLADSLFGLSVVIAGIVMYDAQGVRRAVGKQAEVINTIVVGSNPKPSTISKQSFAINRQAELLPAEALLMPSASSHQQRGSAMAALTDEQPSGEVSPLDKGGSHQRSQNFVEVAKKYPSVESGEVNLQELGDSDGWRHIPLKESVGHTKLEVLIGGLWGITCTLALSHFTDMAFSQNLHP